MTFFALEEGAGFGYNDRCSNGHLSYRRGAKATILVGIGTHSLSNFGASHFWPTLWEIVLRKDTLPMSIQAHIDSLAEKRAHLKQLIIEESAHPMPNFVKVTNLKKQNLALKEEMQRYLIMLGKDAYEATS